MENRNIIILGGTSGIGRALAEILAKDNYVLIVGRSEERAKSFVNDHGNNAHFLIADLSLLNELPKLVEKIGTIFNSVDFIVHTADILRVERLDTSEGLEKSIATCYYSRVLFNQLMAGQNSPFRPERIIHVAFAGFKPPKKFASYFPAPQDASSLKMHMMGQVANDFYGLHIDERFKAHGTKLNIINAGLVDTDIRRQAPFSWFAKMIIPIFEFVMKMKTLSPFQYAQILLNILENNNEDANNSTLLSAKAKGITGGEKVNDSEMQFTLYEHTKTQIDQILKDQAPVTWL